MIYFELLIFPLISSPFLLLLPLLHFIFLQALLLAKEGFESIVYEGRPEIVHIPEESFPIGVNQRGLHTLARIDKVVEWFFFSFLKLN